MIKRGYAWISEALNATAVGQTCDSKYKYLCAEIFVALGWKQLRVIQSRFTLNMRQRLKKERYI